MLFALLFYVVFALFLCSGLYPTKFLAYSFVLFYSPYLLLFCILPIALGHADPFVLQFYLFYFCLILFALFFFLCEIPFHLLFFFPSYLNHHSARAATISTFSACLYLCIQGSTVTVKSPYVITYVCQNFGVRDVHGQTPKSIYQASYLLPSNFLNNFS